MTVWQAAILGLVQGLGEFLPISSSAHLVLVPWLMGWRYEGLTFDVALHMGTLVAVVAYFWRDWLILLHDGLLRRRTAEGRLFWYLVMATIPGALFGYLFEAQAETTFREPLLIGAMLMVMGIILYLADTRCLAGKDLEQVGLGESLWIGMSQALAIIPGVSRSGITMAAGRIAGLDRETAARFSFLMSTPIILGAGVMQLPKLTPADLNLPFITGVVVSAIVGFLSIGFLLRYLTRRSFGLFVWYRLILGLVVIVLALTGIR
ncbi:UDP-diphosphatase [Desulfofundulus thermobenzoicus]|uniref:Undecaprenyl-diphosphatase n=1 Tax=Desulfofundulus thermobenzoicus TaxID=29376 RepID=A0A6N7IS07_9FIRM|nr:undecaprenyl-diphosphate phosphatase [Desulfofundulus thermobenzoicus]MQL52886.1 UDP-diphosphatase [Desulfofundulus thermobenzoicus]HHW44947.1 undecaprenyl-diphosphate phosphatase [Desulfotomaculum sp.]